MSDSDSSDETESVPEMVITDDVDVDDMEPMEIEEAGTSTGGGELSAAKSGQKQGENSKRSHDESMGKVDRVNSSVCPICMDMWTNTGPHRLVCLRCGHLFGYRCIMRWFQFSGPAGPNRCPQCNSRASLKDIWFLHIPRKLLVINRTEQTRLRTLVEDLVMINGKYKEVVDDAKHMIHMFGELQSEFSRVPKNKNDPVDVNELETVDLADDELLAAVNEQEGTETSSGEEDESGEARNKPELAETSKTPEAKEQPAAKSVLEKGETSKRIHGKSTDKKDQDKSSVCTICKDMCSNSGDHRLVSLHCGHLFNHNCIISWLKVNCTSGQTCCPKCNKPASQEDIRFLYTPHKLRVLNTKGRYEVMKKLKVLVVQNRKHDILLAKATLKIESVLAKIEPIVEEHERSKSCPIHTLKMCKK